MEQGHIGVIKLAQTSLKKKDCNQDFLLIKEKAILFFHTLSASFITPI
jgi:hypothetical protein